MEALLSFAGIVGAVCCVAMYAAVSFGKINAEKPLFFLVNGVGAGLILIGAAQEFDIGDLGTIAQELIWAAISLYGAARAYAKTPAWRQAMERWTNAVASSPL
ncbi:MAG: hypothetical protein DCF16_17980 [Alphaproteobacteria bacterium]|jgi:hypothetical protein|nr:MAG: hypothetical protein DCF16_17980 [Alphaproteobacteria bacterium]